MILRCSECNREIGLMADEKGKPELFKCPRTGRVADIQTPISRKTPKRTGMEDA